MPALPVDHAAIEAAVRRHAGALVETPLLSAPTLDRLVGARVWVKAEVLQKTGSFKARGALNRIAALSPQERAGGVVAFSSGNHAQGIAWAATNAGVRALIVMPKSAPAIKVERTRGYGAEVVLFDGDRPSMMAFATKTANERGAVLVPPFDDPYIIAGQGTVGLEIAAQMARVGAAPDAVLVPCSGGGLAGGTAIAVRQRFPEAAIHTVEPAAFDDFARSLDTGARVANAPGSASLCDALLVNTPGELTFAIGRALLGPGLRVTDDEALHAMAVAFNHLKIVVEPGGAVALAALLAGKLPLTGKTVVVVASGGNVDADVFARALAKHPTA